MTVKQKPNILIKILQKLVSGVLAVLLSCFLLIMIVFLITEVKVKGLDIIIFAISALGIGYYFWKIVFKTIKTNKEGFKIMLYGFLKGIAVIVIFSLTVMYFSTKSGYIFDEESNNQSQEETVVVNDKESEKNNTISFFIHKRHWQDFKGYKHTMNFKTSKENTKKSRQNRLNYPLTQHFYWGNFYHYLAKHDKPLLEHLYLEFNNIRKQKKLNRKDFAELLISAVQYIPYNYIKSESCSGFEDKSCIGNVKLGIYAPAEFTAGLKGDCDTRTVLLFVLFSKFNYNVAILNSDHYQHSVLGLNIPSKGKYKMYNRKKYYFVETTAKNCPIGFLPRQVSNINYWDFVLTNKL